MELVGDESTCNDLNCKLLDSLHLVKSGNDTDDTGDMYTASETQTPHSILRYSIVESGLLDVVEYKFRIPYVVSL